MYAVSHKGDNTTVNDTKKAQTIRTFLPQVDGRCMMFGYLWTLMGNNIQARENPETDSDI